MMDLLLLRSPSVPLWRAATSRSRAPLPLSSRAAAKRHPRIPPPVPAPVPEPPQRIQARLGADFSALASQSATTPRANPPSRPPEPTPHPGPRADPTPARLPLAPGRFATLRGALWLWPPLHLAKAYYDVSRLSSHRIQFREATVVQGRGFRWGDLWVERSASLAGMNGRRGPDRIGSDQIGSDRLAVDGTCAARRDPRASVGCVVRGRIRSDQIGSNPWGAEV